MIRDLYRETRLQNSTKQFSHLPPSDDHDKRSGDGKLVSHASTTSKDHETYGFRDITYESN